MSRSTSEKTNEQNQLKRGLTVGKIFILVLFSPIVLYLLLGKVGIVIVNSFDAFVQMLNNYWSLKNIRARKRINLNNSEGLSAALLAPITLCMYLSELSLEIFYHIIRSEIHFFIKIVTFCWSFLNFLTVWTWFIINYSIQEIWNFLSPSYSPEIFPKPGRFMTTITFKLVDFLLILFAYVAFLYHSEAVNKFKLLFTPFFNQQVNYILQTRDPNLNFLILIVACSVIIMIAILFNRDN